MISSGRKVKIKRPKSMYGRREEGEVACRIEG